jgi:hypothetical protein
MRMKTSPKQIRSSFNLNKEYKIIAKLNNQNSETFLKIQKDNKLSAKLNNFNQLLQL